MKTRISLLTILIMQTSLAVASDSEEQTESTTTDLHPIQITVEPAPTPNVVIEAPPTPNVTIVQPTEASWWKLVDPLITLAGIVLAAWLIIWQMGRQHRDSLALQKENSRAEIRTKIYAELQAQVSIASAAELVASSYVRMIPLSLINYRDQVRMGIVNAAGPPIVRERVAEFASLNNEMSNEVIGLISIFENYSIAVPEFEVFQHALNSAMHDVRKAFSALHSVLLVRLPVNLRQHLPAEFQDIPNADHVPAPPNDEELAEVQQLLDAYISSADDIGSYLSDLVVESQNTLLKDLYPDRQVPIREPIDPRLKVITSANSEELRRYFRDETPWGHSCQEAEARIRAQLAEGDQGDSRSDADVFG